MPEPVTVVFRGGPCDGDMVALPTPLSQRHEVAVMPNLAEKMRVRDPNDLVQDDLEIAVYELKFGRMYEYKETRKGTL